jgi:hypothetical protein
MTTTPPSAVDLPLPAEEVPSPKRGRKPKGEKVLEQGADAKWSLDMVEALMEAKFKTYSTYFEHSSNNKKKAEGWCKVSLAINKQFNLVLKVDQVRSKYQNLTKKYRDNAAHGKESTKTGNEPINLCNFKDDEFVLTCPYFAKQPGCGADLGQATDSFSHQTSILSTLDEVEDELINKEVTTDVGDNCASVKKKPRLSPVNSDPNSHLGDRMESCVDKMANSITALSNALITTQTNSVGNDSTSNNNHSLQTMMQKVVETTTQMQESMKVTAKLQAAMLEKLEKLAENK